MYKCLLLLPPTEAVDLAAVQTRLDAQLSRSSPRPAITCADQTITLRWAAYTMRVSLETEDWVAIESAEIAELFAQDHPDRAMIASCPTRLTIAGDPDPTMAHFNDYVFVMQAIESLYRVYAFDPIATSFINT